MISFYVLINSLLKEYNETKKEIKNLKTIKFILFINQYYSIMKGRKNTESKTPKVARTKNGKIMLSSKCAVRDSKKLKYIKEQEASGLSSNLKIRTALSKILLEGPLKW